MTEDRAARTLANFAARIAEAKKPRDVLRWLTVAQQVELAALLRACKRRHMGPRTISALLDAVADARAQVGIADSINPALHRLADIFRARAKAQAPGRAKLREVER